MGSFKKNKREVEVLEITPDGEDPVVEEREDVATPTNASNEDKYQRSPPDGDDSVVTEENNNEDVALSTVKEEPSKEEAEEKEKEAPTISVVVKDWVEDILTPKSAASNTPNETLETGYASPKQETGLCCGACFSE